MGPVLLTRVGEFRQQQFNALHDQIDVGFPRIDGGVMAMFSESFLVRVADDRKLLGTPVLGQRRKRKAVRSIVPLITAKAFAAASLSLVMS